MLTVSNPSPTALINNTDLTPKTLLQHITIKGSDLESILTQQGSDLTTPTILQAISY